ncbi:LysR family transcriptional regulator [Bradyrhizobium cenepequi]
MNVSLRQLRAFVAAADHGSFSHGATELTVTQSGFSLIIRELELQLGVRLFDRTTRRVALTEAGHEFLPKARRILDDLDSACQEVRELRDKRRGKVSVAVLPSVAASIMPGMLATFRERYPAIELRITEAHANQLFEQVHQGEVDIGVGVIFERHDSLGFTLLKKDPLIGVFDTHDPLSKRKDISWSNLADKRYIAINRSRSSIHHLASQAFRETGHSTEPSFEVGSMTSAVAFVQCGLGFTVVPEMALSMLRVEGLETRRIRGPIIYRDIAALWRKKRSLSPAAATFKDELTAHCETALR